MAKEIHVGSPEYMAFLEECYKRGLNGSNFQIARAVTIIEGLKEELSTTKEELDALKEDVTPLEAELQTVYAFVGRRAIDDALSTCS